MGWGKKTQNKVGEAGDASDSCTADEKRRDADASKSK
jgi:hypothetical protein